ncbi:MAG: dephospho-CoA kinase [Clostridia bacterium]
MKVCITGVIGSGKSAIGHILTDKGKTFISCDEINSELLKDADYQEILKENFGDIIVNGEVDRTKLGEIIFSDKDKRELLNKLSHPRINDKVMQEINKEGNIFIEVPLLIESGLADNFDRIWLVLPDKNKQVQIIMDRDHISSELAQKKIMLQQGNENKLVALATDIVYNDYNYEKLTQKVEKLLQKLEN